jgi:hypothetical protein
MTIGRALAACGILLFVAGAAYCVGLLLGWFTRLPYAGAVAMVVGNTLVWFGRSLTTGTLKSDMAATLESERSETLRLQTRLNRMTAALVVGGFTMAAIAAVLVWYALWQDVT